MDDGDSILNYIRQAIWSLEQCNDMLDSSYQCPKSCTGKVGWPRLAPTKDQLVYFIDHEFSAEDISNMLNVSVRTVQRRFREFGLSIRASYSVISDSDLDGVIKDIMGEFPNIGYRRVHGELGRRRIKITQHRIRETMHRVDPNGVAVRWMNSIPRRTYNVTVPLALWHIDGHHKLIRYVSSLLILNVYIEC